MPPNIKLTRSQFSVIVLESKHEDMYGNEKIIYVGQACEWDLTAQGNTLEECRENLEHVLITQNVLILDHGEKGATPSEAPEYIQRVKTSGDYLIYIEPKWIELFGYDRVPIVARWNIDLSELNFKVLDKEGKEL